MVGFSLASNLGSALPFNLGSTGTTGAPAIVPNLQLWLDADDSNTITSSGGSVSQWDDKSASGNNATQGTAANQPSTGLTTLNGRNVLSSDGTNEFFELDSVLNLTGEFTIFIVSNNDDGSTTDMLLGSNSAANNAKVGIVASFSSFFRIVNGAAGSTLLSYPSTPNLLTYTRDASDKIDASFNGAAFTRLFGDVAQSGTSPIGAIFIDDVVTSSDWNGFIAEILIYGRALSATEVSFVNSYLASKWGLSI